MATCDYDNKSQCYILDALFFNYNQQLNCSMPPNTKSTAFPHEVVLPDHQFTATVSPQAIGDIGPFLSSVLKGSVSVSSRSLGSKARSRPSPAHAPLPMSRSAVGKNVHSRKHPAPKHSSGGTLAHNTCGSLKKRRGGRDEPHSPPLTGEQYFATETPSSNHNGLGEYPSPQNQYETHGFSSPDPFTSDHSVPTSLAGFSPLFPTSVVPTSTDSSPYPDRQEVGPEIYSQQNTFSQPIKMDSTSHMITDSWIFPVAQPQQMPFQRDATILPGHPQLASQSLNMNGVEAPSPPNVSSGNHSPAPAFSYHDPCPSGVINGGHASTYTGRSGGLQPSISSSSSFHDPGSAVTPASDNNSPDNSPFVSSGSVIFGSTYVERPADGQLLHCPQCTQRFANQEHFAKHQIKHQKLHRCRVPGCNRVEGFTTPNDRDRHEKSVHKTPGVYFRCLDESCTSYLKTFARRDNLKDHLKRMHKLPPHIGEAEANELRNEIADTWKVDITNTPSR